MTKKEDIYRIISKRIQEERKRASLTQEELSERVDITSKFLSRIECNADNPSLELIIKLADEFGISFVELLTENKKKENKNEKFLKQVQFLTSKFTDKQKEQIINIIKNVKKILN